MVITNPPLSAPRAATGLARYFSAAAQKHWVTSGLAVPTAGTWDFQNTESLGGVFTSAGAGLVGLDDCLIGESDYLVSAEGDCGASATKLRTIGWVHANSLPQPAGTRGIYRCYSAALSSHFVSFDSICEGAQSEGLLGYVLDW